VNTIFNNLNWNKVKFKLNLYNKVAQENIIDFYYPAYSGSLYSNETCKFDSLKAININLPIRLCLRDKAKEYKNSVIKDFYFYIEGQNFNLSKIVKDDYFFNKKYLNKNINHKTLNDGYYSITLLAFSKDNNLIKSREHNFYYKNEKFTEIKKNRIYCSLPWTDLTLREYSAMPCCDLNRNEKIIFNVYESENNNPWNKKSFQMLRKSLVQGDPIYCNKKCKNLKLNNPLSIGQFYRSKGLGRISEKIKVKLELLSEDKKLELLRKNKNIDTEISNLIEKYDEYLNGSIELNTNPIRLSLMVGTVCNIDCIFCPIPFLKDRRTILNENLVSLIENFSNKLSQIAITGGEPLIYKKELKTIFSKISKYSKIQIITNGINLSILKNIVDKNVGLYVRVSLNVASKNKYIYLHEKDFFEKIVLEMKKFKNDMPKATLSPKFIIINSTINEIFKFAVLCKDVGADECVYTTLWLKEQSKIHPDEKIDENNLQALKFANLELSKAKKYCEKHNIKFLFSGWGKRADDVLSKKRVQISKSILKDPVEWFDF